MALIGRHAAQALKELAGWETLEMVQRYAHLSVDHLTQWLQSHTHATELHVVAG
ncbi:hypothetical protein KTE70_23295 [Burkholderia multivorans]|nr:hypothetical protein [Burkholderia multivorans]MBU9625723.1 hypothetical protein [Burkholderia multivorans]